jgi:hypothetical protein
LPGVAFVNESRIEQWSWGVANLKVIFLSRGGAKDGVVRASAERGFETVVAGVEDLPEVFHRHRAVAGAVPHVGSWCEEASGQHAAVAAVGEAVAENEEVAE